MEVDFYEKEQVKKNADGSFCSSMIDFLESDITGTSTYSMNADILTELLQFLKVFSNSEVNKESISSIWDQHLENRKTHNVISARLMKIAGSATVIPLSIVTKMMNQCFVKLKYLESMLELLQQFYLQLVLMSDEFIIFPGDCLKFNLKCKRCGKCVSPLESIDITLFNVPYAILSHLKMMFSVNDHNSIMD